MCHQAMVYYYLFFLLSHLRQDVLPTEPPPTTPIPPTEDEIRLDNRVSPSHYSLQVKSDHDNDKFSGTVNIDIDVAEEISQVKLHCKNLVLENYSLKDSNGAAVSIKDVQIDARLELCVFVPSKNIASGKYTLTIVYSGVFKAGQITGFYKSSYTTVDNQVRYLTATKFEPTYARMAFPCFDEPRFKTIFDISIVHPSSLIALSNEAEVSTDPISGQDGWSITKFKETVPITTYLVAFIVSDFKYTETSTTFGTKVSYTTFW